MLKTECPKCKAIQKELKNDKPDTKVHCIVCGEIFLVKDVKWVDEFEVDEFEE